MRIDLYLRAMRDLPTSASKPRRILLVDCDAFYVQVARLEDPQGAGKAAYLIVGGSATGRGVVTSASYSARSHGVRSAMPTAQALRLCPDAMVVGVPRRACVTKSREIRDGLDELAPVVQAASIDEFYLDVTGTERLFAESLEETAWRIRTEILQRTDISVSIGGGTRRVIAKLAVSAAKPAGVHVVAPGGELDFMRKLHLADIPGIGPSLVGALRDRGLTRVEDALEVQESWLQKWFGEQRGSWLYRKVRGIDESAVNPHERRKSISSERTFFADIDREEDLLRYLLRLVESVGKTLRRGELRARTITVKLRDDDFKTRSASHTVPEPIESDRAIFEVGRVLLGILREKRRRPARLIGIGATNLVPALDAPQLAFFEPENELEDERDRTLSRIVDGLRERFGDQAIVPGRVVRE